MTTSRKVLIILVAAFFLARVIVLGYVISKHGEQRKPQTHNAYFHFAWTCLIGWILYELSQD